MSEKYLTSPVILDSTGNRIAEALENRNVQRVYPLEFSKILVNNVIEAIGNPEYVEDVEKYAAYGITEKGWYIFARIYANDGGFVSVEGVAGYIAEAGAGHVDVAVLFGVASVSQVVVIDWGTYQETFAFKATDLAVRNLDYRVTFYVYDIDEFAKWSWSLATGSFVDGTNYYTLQDGTYTLAEVTAGEHIPDGYYVLKPSYTLTTDTTFQAGKDYYTLQDGEYVKATVTVGEAVTENTYYTMEMVYVRTEEEVFAEGTDYYVSNDGTYTLAEVTAGEHIPNYFVHAGVTFEGMARNITYRCNAIIDCPVTFILPDVEDETHGCWFEIRFRHAGAYSITLVPPTNDVKIATEHTQKETAGINMVNLHYTVVDGVKIWRFMNTHSSIPA